MKELSSSEAKYIQMTETPMPRLVTSMALPAMASMLITTIYNMADTYFVSQIGTSASAAVGVVFAVMSLIQALGGGFGMGSGSNAPPVVKEQNLVHPLHGGDGCRRHVCKGGRGTAR